MGLAVSSERLPCCLPCDFNAWQMQLSSDVLLVNTKFLFMNSLETLVHIFLCIIPEHIHLWLVFEIHWSNSHSPVIQRWRLKALWILIALVCKLVFTLSFVSLRLTGTYLLALHLWIKQVVVIIMHSLRLLLMLQCVVGSCQAICAIFGSSAMINTLKPSLPR